MLNTNTILSVSGRAFGHSADFVLASLGFEYVGARNADRVYRNAEGDEALLMQHENGTIIVTLGSLEGLEL